MASGDTLFTLLAEYGKAPEANAALPVWLLRSSTDEPDEYVEIKAFDETTNQYLIFSDVLPANYAGTTGITLKIGWITESTGGEVVRWEAAFNSFTDNVDNILSKAAAAVQSVNDTASVTAGVLNVATILFTNGAQIDNLAVNEFFILRVNRDAADAADTMNAHKAKLIYIQAIET